MERKRVTAAWQGEPTVANALRISERTLTRKLAEEGTSHEQVLGQLRLSLARQYIKDRGVPLTQIAWLLGYEGSTSSTHAFVRWTGRSPSGPRIKSSFQRRAKLGGTRTVINAGD
jgi:AraC-like DNA-binding protein